MLNLRPARKRRAVPLEKTVQSQVVRLLRSVGAKVYVIGRPPRRDSAHKGTGQTPGLPDVLAFVPSGLYGLARECWAVEVKRPGGDPLRKLRPEQAEFRALCDDAEITHVCGGVDDVLALLVQRGLVKETAHYRHDGIRQ